MFLRKLRTKSAVLGTAAVLTALITTGLTTAPAQAAGPADVNSGISAVTPTISPSAPYFYAPDGTPSNCKDGYLCLSVWDYTKGQWKVFTIYTCNHYSVINWLGDGYFDNRQTKGTTAKFYDQNGKEIWRTTAPQLGPTNWNPVWSFWSC
ncbi:hypothetical protein [Kitasatospora griseola]